jgi:hypothetical protein
MEVHTPEDDFIIKPNQSLHLIKDFDDEISLYIADNEEIVIFLDYQWKENRINDLIGIGKTISDILKLKFSGIATEIEQYEKSHNKFYTEYYKKIEKQEISRVQFNYENRKLAFIFALLLGVMFFYILLLPLVKLLFPVRASPLGILIMVSLFAFIGYIIMVTKYNKSEFIRSLTDRILNSLLFRIRNQRI